MPGPRREGFSRVFIYPMTVIDLGGNPGDQKWLLCDRKWNVFFMVGRSLPGGDFEKTVKLYDFLKLILYDPLEKVELA